MLIYHYDYTKDMVTKYWSVNGPNNNARHRCMYIVPADGIDDDNTRKGDTYPGTTGTTEFTDYQNWLGDKLRTPITNIREEGALSVSRSTAVRANSRASRPYPSTMPTSPTPRSR